MPMSMPTSRTSERLGARLSAQSSQGMSDRVYGELCKQVYQRSRIFLTAEKKQFLTSRLEKHRRQLQAVDWDDYLHVLLCSTGSFEMDNLIDLVATNHTYFFREPSHFDRLREGLLATLMGSHGHTQSPLTCWSVASSSGEEAYSLAITLAEYNRLIAPLEWRIFATDISRHALKKAQAGTYTQDKLNLPSVDLLARYFRRGTGRYEGQCQVKRVLQERVEFALANVFESKLPVPERSGLIFCRNLLIYFDLPSRQQLISKLENMLAPGGLLLIGHTESLFNVQHQLEQLGGGIFRRSH